MAIEELLHSKAAELGFERFGITSAEPIPENEERFQKWLAQGYQGQMSYLANNSKRRQDPREVLPGAKSIIVVAINYNPKSLSPVSSFESRVSSSLTTRDPRPETRDSKLTGRIARYAWGRDYHKILDKKLKQLERYLHEIAPESIQTKRYVDTGPVIEKAYAERAGIGFIGKNTLLISRGLGSWLFLGEILTTLQLKQNGNRLHFGKNATNSRPETRDPKLFGSCGSCTRCLDACPTDAFVAPYQLDARKCIAYLTIEHRGPIAEELQPKMGDWIFGCDICQEVCPYNRKAPVTNEPAFQVGADLKPAPTIPFDEILSIQSDEEYLKRFQGTPLMRAKRAGLRRNAAIAAGNQRSLSQTLTAKPPATG